MRCCKMCCKLEMKLFTCFFYQGHQIIKGFWAREWPASHHENKDWTHTACQSWSYTHMELPTDGWLRSQKVNKSGDSWCIQRDTAVTALEGNVCAVLCKSWICPLIFFITRAEPNILLDKETRDKGIKWLNLEHQFTAVKLFLDITVWNKRNVSKTVRVSAAVQLCRETAVILHLLRPNIKSLSNKHEETQPRHEPELRLLQRRQQFRDVTQQHPVFDRASVDTGVTCGV